MSIDNIMINTNQFEVLAGSPKKWDDETKERTARGVALTDVQIDQFQRGRRGAKLVNSLRGWGLRAISNLQEPAVIFSPNSETTKQQVVEMGIDWANADPDNREFIALKSDLADLAKTA